MVKFLFIPVLFVIACLLAGIYGAVHNQISYTVSPEYFTQFKFHQFKIADGTPDRIGAAIVGWRAAWWMGLVIGIILIPMGLVRYDSRNYFWGMIRVFGIVVVTTLLVGMVGLLIGFLTIDAQTVGNISRFGNQIANDVAYARAGTMHNYSYLGGFIGMITGSVTIFWQR